MENAKNLFKKCFGYTPFHQTYSPAVVELLGGFAGIYDGLSISVAIEKNIEVAASPRTDGKVEIVFSDMPQQVSSFRVSNMEYNSSTRMENYLKSLVSKLHKREVAVGGFDAAVYSPLPITDFMGLVPSYLVSMTLALRKLYPFRLTETGAMIHPPRRNKYGFVEPPAKNEKVAIASMCCNVRREFSSADRDTISELTCLFGKKYYALCVDCRHNSFEHIPMFGEVALIILKIKNKDLAVFRLDNLLYISERAKIGLSAKSLRSIDLDYLRFKMKNLKREEYELTCYALEEIQRVIFGERALAEGDFEQFGQYMIFSHESVRDLLHIVPDEVEKLFRISIKHNGCMGSRMICTEHATATVNLVSANYYEDFIRVVTREFNRETGFEVEPIICIPSDAAL